MLITLHSWSNCNILVNSGLSACEQSVRKLAATTLARWPRRQTKRSRKESDSRQWPAQWMTMHVEKSCCNVPCVSLNEALLLALGFTFFSCARTGMFWDGTAPFFSRGFSGCRPSIHKRHTYLTRKTQPQQWKNELNLRIWLQKKSAFVKWELQTTIVLLTAFPMRSLVTHTFRAFLSLGKVWTLVSPGTERLVHCGTQHIRLLFGFTFSIATFPKAAAAFAREPIIYKQLRKEGARRRHRRWKVRILLKTSCRVEEIHAGGLSLCVKEVLHVRAVLAAQLKGHIAFPLVTMSWPLSKSLKFCKIFVHLNGDGAFGGGRPAILVKIESFGGSFSYGFVCQRDVNRSSSYSEVAVVVFSRARIGHVAEFQPVHPHSTAGREQCTRATACCSLMWHAGYTRYKVISITSFGGHDLFRSVQR